MSDELPMKEGYVAPAGTEAESILPPTAQAASASMPILPPTAQAPARSGGNEGLEVSSAIGVPLAEPLSDEQHRDAARLESQWLQAAMDFETNSDFDLSEILAEKPWLSFPELLTVMKTESKGKRTIQALGDKILLSKMLDNFGIPQMPVLYACHSVVDKAEVEALVTGLESSSEEDAFDIVVKPTHLSSSVGTVILSREAWIAGAWDSNKLVAHMEHFLAQKADATESEALKALVPGFVVQKCYRSLVEFQAPLEMRVVTLWGKAHIGIWWWGSEGPLANRTTWLVRRPRVLDEAVDVYLPKSLGGEPALVEDESGKWRVAPKNEFSAVAFRASKQLDDWMQSHIGRGELVEGVDEGDDWIRCHHPQAGGQEEWEVLHLHTGYNPGFEAALKVFHEAMPAMAAAAEAIAKASGAPFLRSDFFAGSPKWGVRLNEVAYGSGCSMVRKVPGSCVLCDDGPNVATIMQKGYTVAKIRSAEDMLSQLGVHGSSYELEEQDTAVIPGLHVETLTGDAPRIPQDASNALAKVSEAPTHEMAECNCRTLIFAPPSHKAQKPEQPRVAGLVALNSQKKSAIASGDFMAANQIGKQIKTFEGNTDVPREVQAVSTARTFPVSAAVPQDLSIPVPMGSKPGQLVTVMGPVGPIRVPLPAGAKPGEAFTLPIRPPGAEQQVILQHGAQAGQKMSFVGMDGQTRELVAPCAMLPGQTIGVSNAVVVAVPDGAVAGDFLTFMTPRYEQLRANVPAGHVPGQYIWIQY